MRLLIESADQIEYLSEGEGAAKKLYIHGIMMEADIGNKNNRWYPGPVMEKEVNRYMREVIKSNGAVGELSHPATPAINLERVSHKILELKMDGSKVMGKALVLETPMGQIAKGLIEGGVRLGVSSRGVGTLSQVKNGLMEVGQDFRLVTIDLVADPSGPNCFVQGVMENANWLYDETTGNWERLEMIEETKKTVKKLSKRELQEAQERLITNILKTF